MSAAGPGAGTATRRRGSRSAPALIWHQVRYEQLSFWRNPQSAFFTFAFPVLFFIILGAVFGNGNIYGNVNGLAYYTATITALSVMSACYSQLAIVLSLRRQTGILKRMRATPAPAWLVFAGILIHCIVLSLIDVVVILAMSRIYGNPLPGHLFVIFVTLIVGAAAFCALGVGVASLVTNADAAPAVVQFIFFPLVFISGSYFHITSKVLNQIANIFPVRPFNNALLNPMALHRGFDSKDVGILAIWGVLGAAVAIRRFRWDPKPE